MSAQSMTLATPSRRAAGAHRDPLERRGRRGAEPGRHRAAPEGTLGVIHEPLADAS